MADFKAIETFMWVVTLGSFRGAAQKLNTTQPAISQRIAQLEREVGVRLLQRDRRMVLPTPSGRQMMVYAEKLIGLRSEMLAVVGDRSAMRGVLRLGVAETIVHTWLSQLIKSVNHAYPNLSIEIEVDITSNLRTRLLAQEIELAFLLGPLTGPTVSNRPLCDYPVGFLASPALGRPQADRARSGEIPDHHLPAQDPALRAGALAVQPAGPAADAAARQRVARNRHPHGDRRARHCRDSNRDRRKRTGRRPAATADDRPADAVADVFGELAGLPRHRRGGTRG
jgi:DNA-binding transcriptional LysR family regulator